MADKEAWFSPQFPKSGDIESGGGGVSSAAALRSQSSPAALSPSADDLAHDQSLQAMVTSKIAGNILDATKTQARGIVDVYTNVDLLRPFFDVDGGEVLRRLGWSLFPRTNHPSLGDGETDPQRPHGVDLYGPLMTVFSLVLILLLGMKLSATTVHEGTLMGTALGVCFTYWLLASMLLYAAVYVSSCALRFVEVVGLVGYALFGVCVSLLVAYVLPSRVALTFGGLAALSLGAVLFGRSPSKRGGLMLGALGTLVHALFLLYLVYAYAKTYQRAEAAFEQ